MPNLTKVDYDPFESDKRLTKVDFDPFEAPEPADSPSVAAGAATSFGNGAAFGFADEITGAIQSLLPFPYGTGGSRWDEGAPKSTAENYAVARDSARQKQAQFQEEHPGIDFAASLAGGIATGAGAAGAAAKTAQGAKAVNALARSGPGARYASGIGTGAAGGAVGGAGYADGSALEGAAEGALMGAAVAAAAPPLMWAGREGVNTIAQPFMWGLNKLRGPEEQFVRKFSQAAARDGVTPQGLLSRFDELGPESMPAEAAGENVLGLAEGMATLPGKAKDTATRQLRQRAEASQERIVTDILDGLGVDDINVDGAVQQLHRNMREVGRGYDDILNAGVVEMDEGLERLMGSGTMKRALGRAYSILDDDIALGRADKKLQQYFKVTGDEEAMFSPMTGDFGEMATRPTLRVWDYVKRGLDGIIKDGTDPMTGKMSSQAERANALKRELLKKVDEKNPAYAQIRASYADEKAAETAMQSGRRFMREDSETTSRIISELSPAEQKYFRIGAARELTDRVKSRRPGLKQWEPSTKDSEKITAAFGNDKNGAEKLLKRLQVESLYNRTQNATLSNSRTAARQALMEDAGIDASVPIDIARQNWLGLLGRGVKRAGEVPEEMRDAAAEWLFTTDPAKKAQLASKMQSRLSGTGPLLNPLALENRIGGLLGAGGATGGLLAR